MINRTLNRRALLKTPLYAGGLTFIGNLASAAVETAIVETTDGKIRGEAINGVAIFKGIPYGGPTEGTQRFLPPTKPQKWSGIRDVTRTGPRCVQAPGNLFDTAIGEYFCGGHKEKLGLDQQTDSENCLVLNVLTPALGSAKKRPVMVYIHGGGFSSGSGIIVLAADAFPREEDVVLVSVNHRLSVFGYLYLGEFSEKYADSGNAGMLDLVAALEWVRDNIAAFGGDPQNVTIFGESGGGMKISTLLAMPMARGLFHKAIIESGSGLRVSAKEQATQRATEVLKKLAIPEDRVDQLQTIPARQLFTAGVRETSAGPVMDGRSIPHQTWEPKAPDESAGVPMIIGTCKDETAWLVGNRDPATFNLNEAEMRTRVTNLVNGSQADADQLIAIYRRAEPKATPSDLFFRISSDRMMRTNAITQAERKVEQGSAPVYMYFFAYNTPILDGRFRAFHTAELPLVLRLVKYPESENLSRQLAASWAGFARHGNPNNRLLPAWKPYQLDARTTMIFDASDSKPVNDPDREERLELQKLPPAARRG